MGMEVTDLINYLRLEGPCDEDLFPTTREERAPLLGYESVDKREVVDNGENSEKEPSEEEEPMEEEDLKEEPREEEDHEEELMEEENPEEELGEYEEGSQEEEDLK